jgi:arylsulfatase A-like enzyme
MQAKKLPYEASIRVPVLLRGPGIPAGEVRRDPFMFPDFAPTLLDAAGVRSRRLMDGVSMLDVARQGDRGWGRPVLTESGPRRVDPTQPAQRAPYPSGPSPLRAVLGVRTERYLYVEHHTGERELYDLRRDPRQLESLAGEPSVRATERRLARLLDRLQRCQGQACASPTARTSGHRGTDTPGAARR